MAKNTMRRDLVFPVAGHFMLIPYSSNGMTDLTRAYMSTVGVVQSISRDSTLNTVTLTDGNSVYAAAEFVTTQDGTMTYTLGTYDPELEALVSGADFKSGDATDKEMWAFLPFNITSTTKEKVFEETGHPISIDQIAVKDEFGNVFTKGESSSGLTEGQFYYDTGTKTLSFSENDAGRSVYVAYAYEGANVTSIEYKENPKLTTFMAVVIGNTKDKDESSEQRVNIVVDRCTVSGSVTPPTQSNDPTTGWTLTTKVMKSRTGQKPIKIKFEPIVEE